MDRWFYSLCEKLWIKHLNGPIFTMVSFARYKLNVASNKKAMLKLMTEAEKLEACKCKFAGMELPEGHNPDGLMTMVYGTTCAAWDSLPGTARSSCNSWKPGFEIKSLGVCVCLCVGSARGFHRTPPMAP